MNERPPGRRAASRYPDASVSLDGPQTAPQRPMRQPSPLGRLLGIEVERYAWQADAACAGAPNPALWFPTRGQATVLAKAICRGCPVRVECLDHALANGEKWGIWGGTSERERRKIKRDRKDAA